MLFAILNGCAYFNTYYNATQFFWEAEQEIVTASEVELTDNTVDLLNKTVSRCNIVLNDYPESRFRDDAILLRAKAQYHLGEFSLATASLRILATEFPETPLLQEAKLWQIKCDWKSGNQGTALTEITEFLQSLGKDDRWGRITRLRSLGHLTIAEIYEAAGNVDSSLSHLEMAASVAPNRRERINAYFRIAEKAKEENRLPVSLDNYRKVVSSHPDAKRVESAHLEIVRIYRDMEMWEEASREIEKLTTIEKFVGIRADLNLELAKLYEMQERKDDALKRYSLITEEFPKTRASAESYFKLGTATLQEEQDYAEARKYFDNVDKEFRQSTYVPSAKVRVQEIDDLLSDIKAIKELDEKLFGVKPAKEESDELTEKDNQESRPFQLTIQPSENVEKNAADSSAHYQELAGHLYSAGELEAFRFGHFESGMTYFNRIVHHLPPTKRTSQAIYSLSYLLNSEGEVEQAETLRSRLIESYPESEYAAEIRRQTKQEAANVPAEMMIVSESLVEGNPDSAIAQYEKILTVYPTTQYAPVVLLSIAHIYDRRLNNLQKARTVYERIKLEYGETDQAEFAGERIALFDKISAIAPKKETSRDKEKDGN